MTLADLIRGEWTWMTLLREPYPVALMRAFHLMDARRSEEEP